MKMNCNWFKRPQDPAEHNVCVFSHFLLHHHRDKGSQNKVDLSVQKGSLLPTQTDLLSKYIFLFPRSCWSWWQFERAQRLFCKAFKLMWKWKDVLSSSRTQKSCSQKMSFVRPAACYGFWTPANIMSKICISSNPKVYWVDEKKVRNFAERACEPFWWIYYLAGNSRRPKRRKIRASCEIDYSGQVPPADVSYVPKERISHDIHHHKKKLITTKKKDLLFRNTFESENSLYFTFNVSLGRDCAKES